MDIHLGPEFTWGKVQHPVLAYQSPGSKHWLKTRSFDGTEKALRLLGQEFSHTLPRWSPDGQSIYFNLNEQLWSWDYALGQSKLIWSGRPGEIIYDYFEACPDGQKLIFRTRHCPHEKSRFLICDLKGKERELYQGDFYLCAASFEAGFALLFWDSKLTRLCLTTGKLEPFSEHAISLFAVSPAGKIALCQPEHYSIPECKEKFQVTRAVELAWRPAGGALAFMRHDFELCLQEQGKTRTLAWTDGFPKEERYGWYSHKPSWSADGRFLAGCLTESRDACNHALLVFDMQKLLVTRWEGNHLNVAFRG